MLVSKRRPGEGFVVANRHRIVVQEPRSGAVKLKCTDITGNPTAIPVPNGKNGLVWCKCGESIQIDEGITLRVITVMSDRALLGLEAPRDEEIILWDGEDQ